MSGLVQRCLQVRQRNGHVNYRGPQSSELAATSLRLRRRRLLQPRAHLSSSCRRRTVAEPALALNPPESQDETFNALISPPERTQLLRVPCISVSVIDTSKGDIDNRRDAVALLLIQANCRAGIGTCVNYSAGHREHNRDVAGSAGGATPTYLCSIGNARGLSPQPELNVNF